MQETELEKMVGAWPGVTHDVKWECDLVYSVAGKMFVVLCLDGKNQGQLGFKVDNERFLELTDMHGVMPAPYLARAHWVSILHPDQWDKTELLGMVRQSYEMIKAKLPKKIQAELK